MAVAALLTSLYLLLTQIPYLRRPTDIDFSHLATHCKDVRPIQKTSFVDRQNQLAQTLHSLGASAYIAEPGASAAFYANLSGDAWHVSERPLLLLITPAVENDSVFANISILTPSFEATRARLLPIPSDTEIAYPAWAEDANPYEIAIATVPQLQDRDGLAKTVYVDGDMRHFVVEGLEKAAGEAVTVVGAPVEIRRLRERKREDELDIMKCANEVCLFPLPIFDHLSDAYCQATLLAIRAARKGMYIGMRESQARALMHSALSATGLTNVFAITLFGRTLRERFPLLQYSLNFCP